MAATGPEGPVPVALRREGDQLVIQWSDGATGRIAWQVIPLWRQLPPRITREEPEPS